MENITTYFVELTGMTNKTLGSHHVKTYNKMKDKAIFMKNFKSAFFQKIQLESVQFLNISISASKRLAGTMVD